MIVWLCVVAMRCVCVVMALFALCAVSQCLMLVARCYVLVCRCCVVIRCDMMCDVFVVAVVVLFGFDFVL